MSAPQTPQQPHGSDDTNPAPKTPQRPPQGADGGGEATGGIDLTAAVEAIARADVGGLTATALERAERMVATTAPHILRAAADRMARESHDRHIGVHWLRALADEIRGGR